ncbi:hypothetical protein [Fluviicola chungangensis]|uniref:Uncharacterized protein n=1 Tax=Fluviicola chungangensis TaxID=2597671 RepID=A0A556N6Y2_9FLAO|nr:hypothetical protein [Fluviicola chungangensis]TSJ47880.1 hypothetical protein FO442_01760 [Fluviicola chungangensis]
MNQASTPLVFSEGKTFNYLIPLLFCGIASAISFVLFFPLGIILAVTCVLLGSIESGLEFDAEKMEFRKFQSLFGFKWGNWRKINHPDSFHLYLSIENNSYNTPMLTAPAFYGSGPTVKSKSITYNVAVYTKRDEKIVIYEFSSYKMALSFMNHLRALTSYEVVDHIALKMQENQQKRMNRRR